MRPVDKSVESGILAESVVVILIVVDNDGDAHDGRRTLVIGRSSPYLDSHGKPCLDSCSLAVKSSDVC
jgi:hypothetical protein